MNSALLTTVAGIVTGLLTDTTWEQRGSEELVEMAVHTGALPVKSGSSAADEEAPFVLIKPGPFTFGRPQDGLSCTVVGLTWTSGDISDGLEEQDRLLQILAGLKTAQYTGYKLMLPINGQVGEEETRINPHPYYHFSLELKFLKQI